MKKLFIVMLGFLLSFWVVLYSGPAFSGGGGLCGQTPCTTNVDCQTANGTFACPECFVCVNPGPNGTCQPDNTFCENLSGNECVEAICLNPPPNPINNPTGCEYTAVAIDGGATDLADICYYCAPPKITTIDTCGNGVCDEGDQENCSNCPEDCLIPGYDLTCPRPLPVQVNECVPAGITFGGPPFQEECEDGDLCTNEICNPQVIGECIADGFKDCNQVFSDLCCPSGCQGPPIAFLTGTDPCRDALAAGAITQAEFVTCDLDCWPLQACGDGFVQGPAETCDDLPTGSAGINVSQAQCRDPGTPNECTYCGDGFIDSPTEECDGAALGQCQTCTATCVCGLIPPPPVVNLCIFGSSPISSGGGLAPACDCSLNPNAPVDSSRGIALMAMLVFGIGALVWKRRRA